MSLFSDLIEYKLPVLLFREYCNDLHAACINSYIVGCAILPGYIAGK